MKPPVELVREAIRQRKLYTLPRGKYIAKLNQNENPYEVPDSIKEEILREIKRKSWNRYPDLAYSELKEEIAEWQKVAKERIIIGNGSNEVLFSIMFTLLSKGDELVSISPSFSMFENFSSLIETRTTYLRLKKGNFSFPVEDIEERAASGKYKLILLCSPNNPTGNTLSRDELVRILESAKGYVLVDEAYVDFCNQDFKKLIDDYDNLILTRTFSKAFSFPFGRFGYGILPVELAREVVKAQLPYNLNGMTETAVRVLIKNRKVFGEILEKITKEREKLFVELNKIPGIKPYLSSSNFILIKTVFDSQLLYAQLMKRGILIRDVSYYPGLKNHLRITVGKPQENQILIETMNEIVKGL